MIVCITGTPGTGKTTLAKKLAKQLQATYVDGNDIIKKHRLEEAYDTERDCGVIDIKAFVAAILEECRGDECYIIDSHLSHHIPAEKASYCIICQCKLSELKRRLVARKYSEHKIQENLQAEIMEVCRTEAQEHGHRIEFYNGTD